MMEKLRHDLRAVFNRQQGGLGDIAAARHRLIGAALQNRAEPVGGRLQFAAGIAAVALAAIVVATFVYVRAGGGVHPVVPVVPPVASPSATAPKTPRPAAGVVTLDADLLDASTGWILLSNCIQPMTGKCHYSVTHTADGGRTWSKAVQVGPLYDPTNGDAPRTVRFINASDGFVYGGAGAFVTYDGGRSWKTLDSQATFVASITGRGTRAWLMTYPCKKGTLCSYEVRSSVDAGRTWSSPYSLPLNFSPFDSIAFGSSGLLISSSNVGDIELTLDGGATWRFVKAQCIGNNFLADVATADGNELWELCIDYPSPNGGPANKRLFVSEDGGTSWSQRARSQVDAQQAASGYSMVLVSTRAGTALMASDRSTIAISHDSGVTWTQVGGNGLAFQSIRFANTNEGWALDVNENLWATNDGGDHWTQLPA